MNRRLQRDQTVLVVIDVQERLAPVIDSIDDVRRNIERLLRGMAILGVPTIVTEQYVKGLGPTLESLRIVMEECGGYEPVEKLCFSSHGFEPFRTKLADLGRRQVVIAGIETHVCVWQTSLDLLDAGYEVQVVADACSSRAPANREIALQRLAAEGAKLTSTEMALFELTVTSGTDEFRQISRLVR